MILLFVGLFILKLILFYCNNRNVEMLKEKQTSMILGLPLKKEIRIFFKLRDFDNAHCL